MKVPKVFISSTCYDLSQIRADLFEFINELGYEPVLSEHGDILYHPNRHVQESCIEEVSKCQLFVLIIGGRFGGKYKFDPTKSIVNAEFEAAKQLKIPIFAFVQQNVYSDFRIYLQNIKYIDSSFKFPAIQQLEYSELIFNFISQIESSSKNNALFQFNNFQEIKINLQRQFAGLFCYYLDSSKLDDNLGYDLIYLLNSIEISIDVKNSLYKVWIHKRIQNNSENPIRRVLYHFLANKFPDDPIESYNYYLKNPIFSDQLKIHANDSIGPLDIKLVNDYGSRKDFVILFMSNGVERPIIKDEIRDIYYGYDVPFSIWGTYIDRPITFPTKKCRITITIDKDIYILVGGYEISPFRSKQSFNKKIEEHVENNIKIFEWESNFIVIGNTYQINWSIEGIPSSSTTIVSTDQRLSQQ